MTPWRITTLADVEYYDSGYYDSMVELLQDSRVILLRGDTTCSAYNLAHEPPLPLLSLLPLLRSAGRRRQNRDSTSRPRLSAKSASSITSTTSSPPLTLHHPSISCATRCRAKRVQITCSWILSRVTRGGQHFHRPGAVSFFSSAHHPQELRRHPLISHYHRSTTQIFTSQYAPSRFRNNTLPSYFPLPPPSWVSQPCSAGSARNTPRSYPLCKRSCLKRSATMSSQ